jgi:AcrR family transcriptional regulator
VRRAQERVLEQTNRLIKAAKSLYDDASDQDFTVQQLAEGAGMSLQTFYRYFKSKDDLMLAVYERNVQDSVAALLAKYGGEPDAVERLRQYTVEGLRRSIRVHSGGFIWSVNAERVRLSRIFPQAVHEAYRPYEELIESAVADGVEAGAMTPPLPVHQAALVVSTLILGLYRNIGDAKADGLGSALDDAWTFMCAGLGIDPDRAKPLPVAKRSRSRATK